MIEKGRYFRPRLPREQRVCTECNQVEDEIHFMLFCNKYLRPNSDEAFDIFSRLINPSSLIETKAVCSYVSDALKIS